MWSIWSDFATIFFVWLILTYSPITPKSFFLLPTTHLSLNMFWKRERENCGKNLYHYKILGLLHLTWYACFAICKIMTLGCCVAFCWLQVFSLLHELPMLRLLNVGFNPFTQSSPLPVTAGRGSDDCAGAPAAAAEGAATALIPEHSRMRILILNGTSCPWNVVQRLTQACPRFVFRLCFRRVLVEKMAYMGSLELL